MSEIADFAVQNNFKEIPGGYAGTYMDMHMCVYPARDALNLHLYLDLPKPGKRARAELLAYLSEAAARYDAAVTERADARVIRVSFTQPDTALLRMDRFLTQCDTALRPYGREMGVLCAKCRTEIMDEIAFEYREMAGETLPVCAMCLANDGNPRRAGDNRRRQAAKRARMGMLGALVGALVSAACLSLMGMAGFMGWYLPAAGIAYVVDFFYKRFGGLQDKWRAWILCAFSFLAAVLGNFAKAAFSLYSALDSALEGIEAAEEFVEMTTISYTEALRSYITSGGFVYSMVAALLFTALGLFFCLRGFRRRM